MLKVFGALMLVCGCTGIGVLQVNQMDRRIKTLRALEAALAVIEREMAFRIPLLEELLSSAAQSAEGQTKSFLSLCVIELNKNLDRPFYEIWKQAAHKHLADLRKNDLDPILALGSILGKYAGEEQRKAIEQTRAVLSQVLSDALLERNSQSKVYRALGVTAGAFLVILLL